MPLLFENINKIKAYKVKYHLRSRVFGSLGSVDYQYLQVHLVLLVYFLHFSVICTQSFYPKKNRCKFLKIKNKILLNIIFPRVLASDFTHCRWEGKQGASLTSLMGVSQLSGDVGQQWLHRLKNKVIFNPAFELLESNPVSMEIRPCQGPPGPGWSHVGPWPLCFTRCPDLPACLSSQLPRPEASGSKD